MTLLLVAGYENVIEDKDFLIKGIKHDSAVAGKWQGKDFVLTVKVNSGNYRLDLKVMLKDDKRFVNGNAKKVKSCQSERGKVLDFPSCKANKTRPLTSGTCKPRPPMIIYKAYAACKSYALAALNWWMTGPKRLSNALESTYNGSIWLGSKGYSGVAFAMEWTAIKVTSLAHKAYGGLAVALEWSWVQLKSFAHVAWRVAKWMVYWTWYGFAGLAKVIWHVLRWIGTGIWIPIAWIGNALSSFYNFFLKPHVTHIEDFVASLSTPQRIILVSVMGNAVFFILWMIGALLDYRRKR
ncbi:hypothetical protein P5673_024191 [Acropora cervicornis]|uniref:Uncharacterized protein n=1 Tax=Acropora cervicornis TaxID=6130 RepID=A0AAD9Q4G4_ACRCE|nr:hypothetical protein P5673_024191 [Acropora cervicornis]